MYQDLLGISTVKMKKGRLYDEFGVSGSDNELAGWGWEFAERTVLDFVVFFVGGGGGLLEDGDLEEERVGGGTSKPFSVLTILGFFIFAISDQIL
jgi:hypothetical protein